MRYCEKEYCVGVRVYLDDDSSGAGSMYGKSE